MKNYVIFLVIILVLVSSVFLANAVNVESGVKKNFASSGYILKSAENPEKFYFSDNETYKNSYDDQIVFKNTDGKKVALKKENFIHYANGSISSFVKGVLVDLNNIDSDPITYYNFSANKVLKKLGNGQFVAKNLDEDIEFSSLMWKISNTKYLVAASNIQIVFDDDTTKDVKDSYLEIEYADNEIVNVFNNEVNYKTISSSTYLLIDDSVKINLGNKFVTKDDKTKMSLENMTINANDNVNIVELEEYKEVTEENETENNQNNGNYSGQAGTVTANSGGTVNVSNGGTTVAIGDNNSPSNMEDNPASDVDIGQDNHQQTEKELEDGLSIISPKYTIKEFKVTPTGLRTIIEIEDNEARLVSGTKASIMNNATQKVVYTLPETGETQIKIDTASLSPETEYTLCLNATYEIDKIEYNQNFIYKTFRTPTLGVTLEKELFTTNSLAFNIKFDSDSEVTKLDAELEETQQVFESIKNVKGNTEKIEFNGLEPDKEYTIKIKNIFVGNTSNETIYSYTFKTLKELPKLKNEKTHGKVKVDIDKWNDEICLSVPDIVDNSVESLQYNIYTQVEDKETLIYSTTTLDKSIKLKVGDTLKRNTDYYCNVIASFYDNEKTIEYEIANTESSFCMNSSPMPSIRFETKEEDGITFNSIEGVLILEDEGKTINYRNTKVEVIYSSTTKGIDDIGTLTYQGINESLEIPIKIEELKSNETYKLSVYATYDLQDGNGERYGFIGSVLITTKEPIPMTALWNEGTEGINLNLRLQSTQESTKEAECLYCFDLALYLGQEGASKVPYATAKIVDNGQESFNGSIKTNYFDKDGLISQSTFGLSDAQIEAIERENSYCTIVLSNAKDLVSRNTEKSFENIIPVLSNVKTYAIQELKNKNPLNSIDAITMQKIIKSRINNTDYQVLISTKDYQNVQEIVNNNKMNDSTTVGIKLQANVSVNQLENMKYFEYFIYDNNKNLIATSGLIEKDAEKNEVPSALFLISNGTSDNVTDSDIARGGTYFYKYYSYSSAERENMYPNAEENRDYWDAHSMPSTAIQKQDSIFVMYPSTSDSASISYKYKVNDIDNTIYLENGKKYFHQFYADLPINQDNKIEIQEGENTENNGFWNVTFNQLSELHENYNLQVKVLRSLVKYTQPEYKVLTTQRFTKEIQNFNATIRAEEVQGISDILYLENISTINKEKIAKVQIELVDKDSQMEAITIEKSIEELINDNYKINLNKLDLIYKYPGQTLLNKRFKINVKIYYINEVVGYDSIHQFVTYQTVDGDWLKIQNNQEFLTMNANNEKFLYPVVYDSHQYEFDDTRVNVKQHNNLITWLAYSEKGLVRKINNTNQVPILPKNVEVFTLPNVEEFKIQNVIPGIKSEEDLHITSGPAAATIQLDKTYSKDTINSEEEYEIYADIYEKSSNSFIETVNISSTGTTVTNLQKGKTYNFQLYIKNNNEKYYLFDLNKQQAKVNYEFSTIGEVKVENLTIDFSKSNQEKGTLTVLHTSNVNNGFYGFRYEICNISNEPITESISYSLNNENFETAENGVFIIPIQRFKESNAVFGKVYINANRGSFFDFNTKYKFKVTPIIYTESNMEENIGDTVQEVYSYKPTIPEIIVFSKRVKGLTKPESYVELNISISDEDFLIEEQSLGYKLYRNEDSEPFESQTITLKEFTSIRIDTSNLGELFELEDAYKIEIYYDYYLKNKNNTEKQHVEIEKILDKVKNGISIGAVNWGIQNNTLIKLKFYDSYELSAVKSIKCSIYDINGRLLKNVPTVTEVNIIDQTTDLKDPHKSISFNTDFIFESGTSYIISVKFLDETGNELAIFEPENPVTNE